MSRNDVQETTRIVGVCFSAVIAIATLCDVKAEDPVDPKQALGAIAEGYRNNRDAFQQIDCVFELTIGRSATLDQAVIGDLYAASPARSGKWMVNGEHVLYSLLCDPGVNEAVRKKMDGLRAKREAATLNIDCADIYYLQKHGGYSLNFSPINITSNIFTADDQDGFGIRYTPFAMDVMGSNEFSNPHRYLMDYLRGRWEGRFVGTERAVSGQDIVVCEVANNFRVRLGFDPARGYMLASMSDRDPTDGLRMYIAHVLDAKKCSNGAWFPMRTVKVYNPDSGPPYHTEIIKVISLNTDEPVPVDRFSLDLPKDTQVNRVGHPEWIHLSESEHITSDGLPELHQRCKDFGTAYMARNLDDPNRPSNRMDQGASRSMGFKVLVANAIILTLVAAIFVARKLRTPTR